MCDGAYAVSGDQKSASDGVGEWVAVSATFFFWFGTLDSVVIPFIHVM